MPGAWMPGMSRFLRLGSRLKRARCCAWPTRLTTDCAARASIPRSARAHCRGLGQDPCYGRLSGLPGPGLHGACPARCRVSTRTRAWPWTQTLTDDISPGDIVTYTLVLDNNGRSDMNQVWLTDTLPYTDSVFVQDSLRSLISRRRVRSSTWMAASGGEQSIDGAQAFRVYWPTIMAESGGDADLPVADSGDTPASELVNEAVVDSVNTEPVIAESTHACGAPQSGSITSGWTGRRSTEAIRSRIRSLYPIRTPKPARRWAHGSGTCCRPGSAM